MGKVNRMEQAKVQNLALTAARSRLLALDMVYGAASGHIGGSLSSLDILTTLYFHVMRVNAGALLHYGPAGLFSTGGAQAVPPH